MFKYVRKSISAFALILMMAMMLAPATGSETNALGPNPPRFDLIQMRLAKALMTVAPEFTVARYAEATKLPPDVIRAHLEAKAAGMALSATGPASEASNVRTHAGGAKFVTVD